MKTRRFKGRLAAATLAVVTGAGALLTVPARPAAAGKEDTWRYVTYGAGAATVLMGANKKWLPATVGAAGTYLSYQQWQKEKNKRRDRDDRWDYRDRYDDRSSDRYDSRRDDRYSDRYSDRYDRGYRR